MVFTTPELGRRSPSDHRPGGSGRSHDPHCKQHYSRRQADPTLVSNHRPWREHSPTAGKDRPGAARNRGAGTAPVRRGVTGSSAGQAPARCLCVGDSPAAPLPGRRGLHFEAVQRAGQRPSFRARNCGRAGRRSARPAARPRLAGPASPQRGRAGMCAGQAGPPPSAPRGPPSPPETDERQKARPAIDPGQPRLDRPGRNKPAAVGGK